MYGSPPYVREPPPLRLDYEFQVVIAFLLSVTIVSIIGGLVLMFGGISCSYAGGPALSPGQSVSPVGCVSWGLEGALVVAGSIGVLILTITYHSRPGRHRTWGASMLGIAGAIVGGSLALAWWGGQGATGALGPIVEGACVVVLAGFITLARPSFFTVRLPPPPSIVYVPVYPIYAFPPPPPPPPAAPASPPS